MKLATLKSSGRDGRLVLVSRDLRLAHTKRFMYYTSAIPK